MPGGSLAKAERRFNPASDQYGWMQMVKVLRVHKTLIGFGLRARRSQPIEIRPGFGGGSYDGSRLPLTGPLGEPSFHVSPVNPIWAG